MTENGTEERLAVSAERLRTILAEHLGCWETSTDRCGEHSTADNPMPWPCERLSDAVSDVQAHVDRELAKEATGTEPEFANAIKALMPVFDGLNALNDYVVGYRRSLIEGGIEEMPATVMAFQVHQNLIQILLPGGSGE